MENSLSSIDKAAFVAEYRSRLQKIDKLPALTRVASELLRLRARPEADVKSLVQIIETDPVIVMHILRYCRLSHFGYGQRIQSLEDAINLVLGYDRALHLAMGMSAGKSLSMQVEGKLGCYSYWFHSLQTAIMCQELARHLPSEFKASPGIAYLAGLLHDIGFLLLGHMYPREYSVLNRAVEKYSHKEIRELELLFLGVSHDMSGLHLLRAWHMPEEICIAVGEHHFPEYEGQYATYAHLVFLANYLLGHDDSHGRADNRIYACQLISRLGLTDEQISKALEVVESINNEVDSMATEMAA